MKRRDWLRTAAATIGVPLTMSDRHAAAADEVEPPDGPDDDHGAVPATFIRVPPIAVIAGSGPKFHAVALSADGTRLAAAEALCHVFKVWGAKDGSEWFTSPEQLGPVQALAFSLDGTRIASSAALIRPVDKDNPNLLKVLDAATGRSIQEIRIPQGYLIALALTRSGTLVAIDTNDHVKAWKVAGAQESFVLDGSETKVWEGWLSPEQSGFSVSADGQRAVSLKASVQIESIAHPASAVVLWDADAGAHRLLDAKIGPLRAVAISPDGASVLVASTNKEIKAFDFATGETRFDFFAGLGIGGVGPYLLTYSPDGKQFVLGYKDGRLQMRESAKGSFGSEIRGPRTYIRAVAFLEDRLRVVSGGILEVGVVKWPNGARTWKHEPLWVWDVMLKRFPDGTEQFRQPPC